MAAMLLVHAQTDQDRIVDHFKRGQEAAAQQRYKQAIAEFHEALKIDPDLVQARANLGLMYYLSGQYEQAIAELSRVVKSSSGILPAQLFLGISYLRTGRPAEALQPLSRALEIDPANTDALRATFTCDLALGRYGAAGKRLQEIIAHGRDPVEAHYQAAHGYFEMAAALTESLAQNDRISGWAHRLAGDLAADRKDWTEAVDDYRKALAADPQMPGVRAALAATLRASGASAEADSDPEPRQQHDDLAAARSSFAAHRFLDAADGFATAFAKGNTGAEIKYYLVRIYTLLASDNFSFLINAAPDSGRSHQLKAELAFLRRDFPAAASEYEIAARELPDEADVHERLGETEIALGRGDAAKLELEHAIKLSSGNGRAHYLLGQTLMNANQPDAAIAELKLAIRYSPSLLDAHAVLGSAYMHAHEPALAIPELTKALKTDYYGDLHFQLYRAYQATGNSAAAEKALSISKEMRKKSVKAEAAKLGDAAPPIK